MRLKCFGRSAWRHCLFTDNARIATPIVVGPHWTYESGT